MRVLVIGFAASIHLARHLDLLAGTGWDVHVFDSSLTPEPHPDLPAVTLHPAAPCDPPAGSAVEVATPPAGAGDGFAGRVAHLCDVLDDVRPHVVHSQEIQHAGTLTAAARRRRDGLGAPWLVTNWGSDVYWWGRLRHRAQTIRSVVGSCDWYGAECHRDVALARAFGLRGRVVGVWPVAGGIDIEHARTLQAPGPTSERRAIAVKSAVSVISRGDVALDALGRCADLLDGWELCGYQTSGEFEASARKLAAATGMRYTVLSGSAAADRPHDEILAMHGRARVSLGLNRSDALSTSFLEAIAMGAFPVQGRASCGNELVVAGRDALFVPPSDVDAVTAALRRALTDDAFVDAAAARNARTVAAQLDRRLVRARVVDAYERIALDVHEVAA